MPQLEDVTTQDCFFFLAFLLHNGLYVADGSIIRSALEVNPFLTISALTERIVENIIAPLSN